MSEIAWLVEDQTYARKPPVRWLTVIGRGSYDRPRLAFTFDAGEAIRFARRADAEAAADLAMTEFEYDEPRLFLVPTEHVWCDGPPSESATVSSAVAPDKGAT